MTANDVSELRRQGRIEEAYDAIRALYAEDKGPDTSAEMFRTAVDILKKRLGEGRVDEARKIQLALERMLPNVPDKDGWALYAMATCRQAFEKTADRTKARDAEPAHLDTGRWGEEMAAAYLRDKGYVILQRDWHSGHRDIDIIARRDEYYVFVEVKTRRASDFGDPAMAVDYRKRRNLLQAMNHYISSRHIDNPVRFDIITVVGSPGCDNPVINHLEDVLIT